MPSRLETIPVPYASNVELKGGRKEHRLLLLTSAPVRIPCGPTPPQVAEIRVSSPRPAQIHLPSNEVPPWIGAEWRYHVHPDTGELLTDWRPLAVEDMSSVPRNGIRSVMGLSDMLEGIQAALEGDVPNDRRAAIGPACNPFVNASAWNRDEEDGREMIVPEGSEFRRMTPIAGARDEAIAAAGALASRFFATDDGRLLVPVHPPRWVVGCAGSRGWTMPWPGALKVGLLTEPDWPEGMLMVPADRRDVALILADNGGLSESLSGRPGVHPAPARYGRMTVDPGFRPEPELLARLLEERLEELVEIYGSLTGTSSKEGASIRSMSAYKTGIGMDPSSDAASLKALVAGMDRVRSWMSARAADADATPPSDLVAHLSVAASGICPLSAGLADVQERARSFRYGTPEYKASRSLLDNARGLERMRHALEKVLMALNATTGLDLPRSPQDLPSRVAGPSPLPPGVRP